MRRKNKGVLVDILRIDRSGICVNECLPIATLHIVMYHTNKDTIITTTISDLSSLVRLGQEEIQEAIFING
jgi:hypothetical protein